MKVRLPRRCTTLQGYCKAPSIAQGEVSGRRARMLEIKHESTSTIVVDGLSGAIQLMEPKIHPWVAKNYNCTSAKPGTLDFDHG